MTSLTSDPCKLELGEISPQLNISSLTVSTAPSDSKEKSEERRCNKVVNLNIALNPGITLGNYVASLLHVMIVQFNHTVTTTLQPLILLDPASYEVDKSQVGMTLAKLMLLQTLTKICLTPFYGYLMDHVGRKPIVLLGAFTIMCGYFLVPFQNSVFPGYAISKILVANGGNMMTLAPLNADYIHDSTKGKATAISMAVGSVGQFLGTLFISILLKFEFTLRHMHVIAGLTVVTVVLCYSSKIKSGRYFLENHEKQETQPEEERDFKKSFKMFIAKIKQAFSVLGQNSWLMISVTISVLARADSYLITIVFALFVKSFDETPEDLKASNSLINSYQNLFFGLGVIGNLIYGVILDRVNTLNIIFPTLVVAMAGYTVGSFAESKDSPLLFVLIFFAGSAMPGFLNSANYLAIKNFPRDLRGVLSSLISVMGVAGYLLLSTIGGYLFDNYGRSAPFLLFVCMLALSTLAIIYISIKNQFKKRVRINFLEDDQSQEAQRLQSENE